MYGGAVWCLAVSAMHGCLALLVGRYSNNNVVSEFAGLTLLFAMVWPVTLWWPDQIAVLYVLETRLEIAVSLRHGSDCTVCFVKTYSLS